MKKQPDVDKAMRLARRKRDAKKKAQHEARKMAAELDKYFPALLRRQA